MNLLRITLLSAFLLCLATVATATNPVFQLGSGLTSTTHSTSKTATAQVTVGFLADGTIQVKLNNKLVGSGVPTLQWTTPTSSTGVALSATQGRITQTYAAKAINIIYDCVLSGTDLNVTAHVTNNGSSATAPIVLVMPPFTFSAAPVGTMPTWHISYIDTQGPLVYHPSVGCPLGCVYAGDKNYAVSAWSPSEMSRQSIIQGAFLQNGVLSNPLPIEFYTLDRVAPKATTDISLVMRVTIDQTPGGLLGGYKLLLPALSYTPVAKPMTAFQSIDSKWVTPTDPYGYNGASRRIDRPAGVQAYLNLVTPMLKSSGGSGVIFWAPGGFQAGSFYPIDFDVNLNRISATWPAVVKGMQANGYRVGICARLADTLNADGITSHRSDPTSATDVSTMLARLDAVANTGVDTWYVDSACEELASTTMVAIAKKHLPANHLLYTEYANDVTLSFAGAYCEWTGTQTKWMNETQRAHLQFLYPKATWLCVDRSGTTSPAQLVTLGFQPLNAD